MIKWLRSFLAGRPAKSNIYRVVRRVGGFEPQFSYTAGMEAGLFWYPLNKEGYWHEPDAFTKGDPTKRSVMSRAEADRAILRARAVNEEHIRATTLPSQPRGSQE